VTYYSNALARVVYFMEPSLYGVYFMEPTQAPMKQTQSISEEDDAIA
jgi:hypothetical protein